MNCTKLFIFSLLLIIGATQQVKENQEKQINIQKALIEKAAHLVVYGVERVAGTDTDDISNKIDTHLAELENSQDDCSVLKTHELKALKNNNVGLEICLNLTDTISNLDIILNNATNVVLDAVGDLLYLSNDLINCTVVEDSNLLQCIENALISLRSDADDVIGEITELLEDVVPVILTPLQNAINCLNNENTVTNKLATITNRNCQTESNVVNSIS